MENAAWGRCALGQPCPGQRDPKNGPQSSCGTKKSKCKKGEEDLNVMLKNMKIRSSLLLGFGITILISIIIISATLILMNTQRAT